MCAQDERVRERLDHGALRVIFITDIMTPYMAPVFEALASRCDLTVLFGSKTGIPGHAVGRSRVRASAIASWAGRPFAGASTPPISTPIRACSRSSGRRDRMW